MIPRSFMTLGWDPVGLGPGFMTLGWDPVWVGTRLRQGPYSRSATSSSLAEEGGRFSAFAQAHAQHEPQQRWNSAQHCR
jgi:hypothetical protein